MTPAMPGRWLLLAGLLRLLAPCCAAEVPPEATFHVSYAAGTKADVADGDPQPEVVGTVSATEGLADRAIVVGPQGWLQYALKGNLNQDDVPGSIELWIKPVNWDGASRLGATLFSAEYDNAGKRPNDQGIFRLYTQGNGRLTFIAGPYPKDDLRRQVWAQCAITGWRQGEWRHVVATWDGVDLALYVDGEQAARNRIQIISGGGEDPRFKPSLGSTFTVGGTPWGDTGLTAVDEVTIYRRALRPGEVSRQYQRKRGLLPAGAGGVTAEPPARLTLPLSPTPPEIDGRLAPGEWDDASALDAFVALLVPQRKLWPGGNRLYCKLSGPHLYLGLRSPFHEGRAPTAEAASHSGQVFDDDCFEIFLTTDREPTTPVLQLVVNSRGSLDVYRCRPRGVLVQSDARAAAVVEGAAWTAELSIPLAEITGTAATTRPDKLLFQISRSYKAGSRAERAAQRQALQQEPLELYAGYPWNMAFLDTKRYAELIIVPAARRVVCAVEANRLAAEGRLVVKGRHGASSGLQVRWQGPETPLLERVAAQPDGSFTYEREAPAEATALCLQAGDDFHLDVPISRGPALALRHVIYSHNDTIEVTVDAGGLTAPAAGLTASLTIKSADGRTVAERAVRLAQPATAKETLSLKGLPAGTYALECVVPQAALPGGQAVARESFRIFRSLPGQGQFEYLAEEVPAPWTPVAVEPGHAIGVWGRTYRFGGHLLPEIIAQGKPLLSGHPSYQVELGDGTRLQMTEGAAEVVERKPVHARLRAAATAQGVTVRQLTTIEYDGMMRFDVEVESRQPIRRLALRVPYLPERAEVFQPTYCRGKFNHYEMDALEVKPGFSWTSEYLEPALLLSDMRAGLSWFAASDRTWVVDEGRKKVEVSPEGFVIHFVDTAQEGPRRLSFTFGLQAFPTRPPRDDWREFGRVREAKWMSVFVPDVNVEKAVDGRVLPDYFTKIMPDLHWGRRLRGLLLPFCNFPRSVEDFPLEPETHRAAVQALHDTLKQARAAGFEYVVPYLTPTYATLSLPEWQFYWSNWIALPRHIFESFGEPCASVANKQWTDFWLYSFEQYARRYQIKGVFHDMAMPYAEEGTLNGLGYDRNGVRYPEYPLWELRDLYKKIYTLHRKLFPDAMSFMNYGIYTPAIHSFTDFVLCAERYETRADRSIYDLDGDGNLKPFRWQCALPFGPKAMHNGWLKYPLAINEKGPTVHLYGIVLLHDLVQWNINEHPQVRAGVHELKRRMGIGYDRQVEFLPYWEHGDKVQLERPDVAVSFYRRGEQLMAVVVNTRMAETYRGPVVLDLKRLGLNEVKRVEIYDPLENTYTPAQAEPVQGRVSVSLEIGPTLFQAILVN